MRFGYCHWIVSPCKVRWLYQHEAPASGSIVDRPSRPIRILQTRKLRMEYPNSSESGCHVHAISGKEKPTRKGMLTRTMALDKFRVSMLGPEV